MPMACQGKPGKTGDRPRFPKTICWHRSPLLQGMQAADEACHALDIFAVVVEAGTDGTANEAAIGVVVVMQQDIPER